MQRSSSFLGGFRPICLLALLAYACASSGGLPDHPVMKDYEPTEWIANLKSGLTVIVKEDHSAPQVTIASVFGVGGANDPKGKEGLAHFVEHLAFRTRPGGGPQYWDLLKRLGGNFNASTSHDLTSYYTIAHKSNLYQMMQLEAWRLSRTIQGVTPEVFKTEREVVRNELRQRWENTAGNKMIDLVMAGVYPQGHPQRNPVGGTHESLSAITLEDAQKFVKDHYKPSNTTVVISGDFSTEEVKKYLGMWPRELHFGPEGPEGAAVKPEARLGERNAPPVPDQPQTKDLVRLKGPTTDYQLVLAWALPPGFRGGDTVADFAADRLNLAISEGLEIDEEDDIQDVGAFVWTQANSSMMMMIADLKPGADPEKARRRLLDVLVNTYTTDAARLQTEATRWFSATGLLLNTASPVGSAIGLAEYVAATGKTNFYNDQLEKVAKIKTDDVSDFSYRYLTRERAAAVFFEPESNEIPRLVGGGGGGAAGGQPAHNIGGDIAVGGDYSPAQIRKVVTPPNLGATPKHKLANGLEVYTINSPGAPVAQLVLGLRGGNATTKPVNAAGLSVQLSRSRCRDHGSLTPLGGRMGTGVMLAASNTSVAVMSGNLANGIAVLSDNVRCREADEEIFLHLPRQLELLQKRFTQQEKRPEYVAGKRLYGALYPNHPFSEMQSASPIALKDLKREDAQSFVSSHFRPDNGALVVYGDVAPEDVKKASDQYLALWPTGGGASSMEPPAPPSGPSARQVFLIDRPKSTQATVLIGCRLVDVKPDTWPAYDVLEQIANERAWDIRALWGATYGVHAGVARLPASAAHLSFSGLVENAQVGKSIARLLDIVAELGSGKVNEQLFAVKRWDAGRSFMSDFASPDSRASAILDMVERRWPIETWDKYPENLANTTPASLKAVMEPCVGKEIVAVVGDATALRPQFEKEGLKLESK